MAPVSCHKQILLCMKIARGLMSPLTCSDQQSHVGQTHLSMSQTYRDLDPDKFVTLTNGFDPRDFADLNKSRATSGPVLFSYIGEFAYGRTPEPFLRALK